MTDSQDRFLTVKQVSNLTHTHYYTVVRWIKTGMLPAVKLGGRILIEKTALDRVIKNSPYVPAVAPATYLPSPEEVLQGRTKHGGWTKAKLAEWGVPWPPPRGWRKRLEAAYAVQAKESK